MQKIELVCVGKTKAPGIETALEEYASRLSEVRKSLDREIEARLKWLDQQPPDVIERN